jgi:alcohol dehydrogenase (cytochrome c)/quinohemoprotein ethanol dehydrogenase
VDGEQYVAIVVGTGGSWAATYPGPTNLKGNDLPNISRVLAYKLGGSAALPPPPPRPDRVLAPPPATASDETVQRGGVPYGTYCARCHGFGAVNEGILPDLRYSAHLATDESWASVVRDGALAANGMAGFAAVLSTEEIGAIRAYVIAQAHATAGN